MNTTNIGKEAEDSVAIFLQSKRHVIQSKNWRTRWCEIDIVSTYKRTVYFTEVKYRGSQVWGSGFDYITPAKLRQMRLSAEFWLHDNKWAGRSQLLAAEVDAEGNITLIEV